MSISPPLIDIAPPWEALRGGAKIAQGGGKNRVRIAHARFVAPSGIWSLSAPIEGANKGELKGGITAPLECYPPP